MADKPIGYLRVSEEDSEWLKSLARDSDSNVTNVVRVLISRARRLGWTVSRIEPLQVKEPE